MSLPRQILPGKTYLVTRRCTQRQFLLKPSKDVKKAFLFSLAIATRDTGVEVHVVMVMSNHYHLIVTDPFGLLPRFMYILNKYVSKCLNATYGRWENFWAANEQPSYVELADPAAVLAKTIYAIVNPVEAGLVKSHAKWPGLVMWKPGVIEAKRPDVFFREEGPFPESLQLEITLPPLPDSISGTEDLGKAVEFAERLIRRFRRANGKGFLGVRAVLKQSIYDSPRTHAPKRRLSPRVATRNKWRRIEVLSRIKSFVAEYRASFVRWLAGERDVVFPPGTYAMRFQFGVRVAEA